MVLIVAQGLKTLYEQPAESHCIHGLNTAIATHTADNREWRGTFLQWVTGTGERRGFFFNILPFFSINQTTYVMGITGMGSIILCQNSFLSSLPFLLPVITYQRLLNYTQRKKKISQSYVTLYRKLILMLQFVLIQAHSIMGHQWYIRAGINVLKTLYQIPIHKLHQDIHRQDYMLLTWEVSSRFNVKKIETKLNKLKERFVLQKKRWLEQKWHPTEWMTGNICSPHIWQKANVQDL